MVAWQRRFFLRAPVLRLIIIGFLFVLALGFRLYDITEPTLTFPTRQYRSALIARGYYFEALDTAPAWKRDLASLNKQREGILEPPIMELMVSFIYRVLGGEYLWIPRVLSTIFWMVGGVFLYLIARKILSAVAVMFCTAFYLFLPFGIAASRSFQPEPLMIMMLLISIFTILRYHERPSGLRLGVAASISSLAVFIKPVCLFLILGAFFSVAIYRQGIRKSLTSLTSLSFAVATLSLTMIYYGYGIFITGFLRNQAEVSFLPHLLFQPMFWGGWLKQITEVIGGTCLIGALLGILMIREASSRALLVGLWSSYFVFGLVFTYHIHTHDYYHLQFVPVVALSLGPIGALIIGQLSRLGGGLYRRRADVLGILLFAGILSLMLVAINVVLDTRQRLREQEVGDAESRIQTYEEIGEIVDHSPNTLFWTPDYGKSLEYYGWLSGQQWPRRNDIKDEELLGEREISVEERLNNLEAEISPEYFIVILDSEWFREQKDLRDFLTDDFSIVVEHEDYLVFDLKEKY